jgi:uncharacterized membrane protein YebE (DUF533 family)
MKTLIVAIALLVTASSAFANTGAPKAHQRQVRQQHRIEQGMRRGGLTRRETMRLERGHTRIQREIGRAKADGRITKGERARIMRMQGRESRHIWRQRHDRQRAT